MSDAADEQARWKQLESWAADRVKHWPRKLQIEDYDFRGWARGASKNCLHAGAVYEYTRESRKLRCLLALMNPKRSREPSEIMRTGSIDGRRPKPGEIGSYPAETNWLPCCFDGLDEHNAERALGGFFIAYLIWLTTSRTISTSESCFARSEMNWKRRSAGWTSFYE
jgi:hypothetical protein